MYRSRSAWPMPMKLVWVCGEQWVWLQLTNTSAVSSGRSNPHSSRTAAESSATVSALRPTKSRETRNTVFDSSFKHTQ